MAKNHIKKTPTDDVLVGVENLIDKASVFLHYLIDKSINAVTSSLYLLN